MRTARALFASIGTSVMLLAAVTLSLLSVSAVFALGGFEGAGRGSSGEALVLKLQERSGSDSGVGGTAAVGGSAVVERSSQRSRSRSAARRSASRRGMARAQAAARTSAPARARQVGSFDASPAKSDPPATAELDVPATVKKSTQNLGDGVKQLGDGLSSTVKQTGAGLAEATASLSPPVSAAVQQLLNVVGDVLKGTTDGLGNLLGATP